jgi:hypothetical protein
VKIKLDTFFDFLNNKQRQRFLKKLNIFFAISCTFFIINNFKELNIDDVSIFNFDKIEIILCLVFYLNSGTLWSKFMLANYSGKFIDYFFNWSYSKIGKYIPSGIMTVSVRLNQNFEKKQNQKVVFYGLVEEQFLIPFIAIPPLIFSLLIGEGSLKAVYLLVGILIMFIAIKIIYPRANLNYTQMVHFNTLFLLNYLFPILLFNEIATNLNYSKPLDVSISYFLAICIGLFFIGVPAGIGIREFIFLGYVSNFLPDTSALPIIIKIRVLFLIFDIVFGITGLLYTHLFKKN